jgi:hypothetical protein
MFSNDSALCWRDFATDYSESNLDLASAMAGSAPKRNQRKLKIRLFISRIIRRRYDTKVPKTGAHGHSILLL